MLVVEKQLVFCPLSLQIMNQSIWRILLAEKQSLQSLIITDFSVFFWISLDLIQSNFTQKRS